MEPVTLTITRDQASDLLRANWLRLVDLRGQRMKEMRTGAPWSKELGEAIARASALDVMLTKVVNKEPGPYDAT